MIFDAVALTKITKTSQKLKVFVICIIIKRGRKTLLPINKILNNIFGSFLYFVEKNPDILS